MVDQYLLVYHSGGGGVQLAEQLSCNRKFRYQVANKKYVWHESEEL